MKKARYIIIAVAIAGLSSCGIFKKDCHCPHFSNNSKSKATALTAIAV
ncbi:MAG TPA: hypothetical protein VJ844_07725 [Mucilaginibacter sp.]|nr:hypothetical protein [Mucilaginibacter sp.]